MENKKYRTITISGMPVSGKSTQVKYLVKKYEEMGCNVKTISVGTIFRQIALKRGISIGELNAKLREEKGVDEFIDASIVKQYNKMTGEIEEKDRDKSITIIDSRLAWKNIPKSFAVRMTVEENEAAVRLMQDKRGQEDSYENLEEAKKAWKDRMKEEVERYKERYNVDLNDKSNYDLVVDSSKLSTEQIGELIINGEREKFFGNKEKILGEER